MRFRSGGGGGMTTQKGSVLSVSIVIIIIVEQVGCGGIMGGCGSSGCRCQSPYRGVVSDDKREEGV